MSILTWFRGLFGKPSKKRQVVDNDIVYVDYITDKYPNAKVYKNGTKWQKITDFPPRGPLNEDQAKFMLARFATSTDKQVARKLNKLGYLTPRGKQWAQSTVKYWRLSEAERQTKREKSLDYFKNKPYHKNRSNNDVKNSGLQTAVYIWPKAGRVSSKTARKVTTDLAKMGLKTPAIAAVMNHHGLLTPKGKMWTAERAQYFCQDNQQLERRRQYWRDRDKTNKQPQTMIFRTAQMRPRQNGVN